MSDIPYFGGILFSKSCGVLRRIVVSSDWRFDNLQEGMKQSFDSEDDFCTDCPK